MPVLQYSIVSSHEYEDDIDGLGTLWGLVIIHSPATMVLNKQ